MYKFSLKRYAYLLTGAPSGPRAPFSPGAPGGPYIKSEYKFWALNTAYLYSLKDLALHLHPVGLHFPK